jgi:DNA-binding NarL/FixJ family response regulator
MLTVAIVDGRPMVRAGLAKLLAENGRFQVVASVADVVALSALPPTDLAALDLPVPVDAQMLELNGCLAGRSRVLVTSAWTHPPSPLSTVRVGVRACLTRHSDEQVILTALEIVAVGGLYTCPESVAALPAVVATAE